METTIDRLLGGRVLVEQPTKGYRAAIDPVLLASSIMPQKRDRILDVGCGVGTVSLCLLQMWGDDVHVEGFDCQPALIDMANRNLSHNEISQDLRFYVDSVESPSNPVSHGYFDHVVSNPPFYKAKQGRPSRNNQKCLSHHESNACLETWVSFCLKRLKPRGTLTLMYPPERLGDVLRSMTPACGSVKIFPLWTKPCQPAKRVVIQGVKNARGPLMLLPGLILHENNGDYTPTAHGILTGDRKLADLLVSQVGQGLPAEPGKPRGQSG